MASKFMESVDEVVKGARDVYDGFVNASADFKQGLFKKKTGEELWDIFENTIGNGILKTLEGALHVVESANEAWDKFEHKVNLFEMGMSEKEYEQFCRECDAEAEAGGEASAEDSGST